MTKPQVRRRPGGLKPQSESPALAVVKSVVPGGREYTPTPRLVKVTPVMAEDLLTRNTMNRPLTLGLTERYMRDMIAGEWKMNGDAIRITKDGDLLDGQHRLFAIVESGCTIEMLIVEGLDPDVMHTIDTGKRRSFGDVLAIGGERNTTMLAGAARWVAWYMMRDRIKTFGGLKATNAELGHILDDNKDLAERCSEIASVKTARKIVSPSILAFVYMMAFRSDPAKAGQWLGMLNTGAFDTADAKHPVLQLRERMLSIRSGNLRMPPEDVCALAIKSWNQYKTGKRTNTLRWSSQESFPEFAE